MGADVDMEVKGRKGVEVPNKRKGKSALKKKKAMFINV